MTTKNTQNEIFYSDGEGDDPLVSTGNDSDCCSDSHPPTGEGNNIQTPLLRGLLIPAEFEGWTDDEGFSIAKVSGSNGEGRDEAVVRSRPKVGDPALQSIMFNLESATPDGENEVAQPGIPAHLVTYMLWEVTKGSLRKQANLETKVAKLEHQLRETQEDLSVIQSAMRGLRIQFEDLSNPPNKFPTAVNNNGLERAQRPEKGKRKTFSCHYCNFIYGGHSTARCFRNPERFSRP